MLRQSGEKAVFFYGGSLESTKAPVRANMTFLSQTPQAARLSPSSQEHRLNAAENQHSGRPKNKGGTIEPSTCKHLPQTPRIAP
ncbi:MAG: hypothetical protein WBV28_00355 [Terracidiphilus sp.]